MRLKRKIYWTKEFDASHYLVLPYESKCQRIHGHTYKVEVEIEGELNEYGMIFDFNHLSEIIKELDHKILVPDSTVMFSQGMIEVETQRGAKLIVNKGDYIVIPNNATAEKIAEYILERVLERAGDNVSKIRVRVWEDPRSYAEVEY